MQHQSICVHSAAPNSFVELSRRKKWTILKQSSKNIYMHINNYWIGYHMRLQFSAFVRWTIPTRGRNLNKCILARFLPDMFCIIIDFYWMIANLVRTCRTHLKEAWLGFSISFNYSNHENGTFSGKLGSLEQSLFDNNAQLIASVTFEDENSAAEDRGKAFFTV